MTNSDRSAGKGGVTEVARLAGVSIATVSRVINHPEIVAPKTLERVKEAMDQLDFQVNHAASGLRRGNFRTIAIIVASLSQPWYTKLIRAVRVELEQRNFRSLIFDLEHDQDNLRGFLESAASHGSNGLIVSTGDYLDGPETQSALAKARARMPLVVAGQYVDGATWPTVQYADRLGALEATRHLLDVAGPPVAFLGALKNSYHGNERRAGYEDALTERGLDPAEWIWDIDDVHYEAGYHSTLAQVREGRVPRAILAVNDEIALGAQRAVTESGLRIPEDVALVGFGDTPFLPYVSPSLSSVNGSAEEIARRICDALWAMLDEVEPVPIAIVERTLVVRESSRGQSAS